MRRASRLRQALARALPTRGTFAAALALWLLATAAAANPLPEPLVPFEARYRVGNGTLPLGTATFRLGRNSKVWRYQSVLRIEGVFALFVDGPLRETTWLELHEGGLRPLAYRHERGEEKVRVVFNWADGQAKVSADDGEDRRVELEPTTRDQFSAILAVIGALAAGERSLAFPGIDNEGDPEPLHFEVTGEERLNVPMGRFQTVRVERRHNDERTTVTWLAPGLNWLPVRVEQRENGKLIARLELTALESGDELAH